MSFWYLASPYSKYPHGMERAYVDACKATASIVRLGIPVFSPIAHSHSIAVCGDMSQECHDTWLAQDVAFMAQAHGLFVLMLDGWDDSYGVQWEIEWMRSRDKPVYYLRPENITTTLHKLGIA